MNDLTILEQQAVDAAVSTRWRDAVAANQKIIRLDKKNIDAILRLGFAYLQLKNIKEAKKWYKKAAKLQPGNYTISENLERIKVLAGKKGKTLAKKSLTLDPSLFLEIPGRTKSVTAVFPGQKNILASLTVGQQVMLMPKKRRVEIRTMEKEYIGCLPDDLSRRLSILMKAGSVFSAYIKEAGLRRVVVFLQEVKRGKKVWRYSAFPTNVQSHLSKLNEEEETKEEEEVEDLTDADLERLAEVLASEEKEYLPYKPGELVEEEAEEE